MSATSTAAPYCQRHAESGSTGTEPPVAEAQRQVLVVVPPDDVSPALPGIRHGEVAVMGDGGRIVCHEGLVPHRIARRLVNLGPSFDLTWLRVASGASEPEVQSRALVHLVRNSLASLDSGPAWQATELLLGVGRTRGLLRKDRRQAAAQVLGISREYFRKWREEQPEDSP